MTTLLTTTFIVIISLSFGFSQADLDVEGKTKLSDFNDILEINSTNANSWIKFINSTGNKGYIGIWNGDHDIDVGTNTSIGKTHIVTNTIPRITADVGGNVGIGTTTPNAILDIESTNSGLLIPRMTTSQRNGITAPSNGLMVYNTSTSAINYYNGSTSSWGELKSQVEETINLGSAAFSAQSSDFEIVKTSGNGGARINETITNGGMGMVASLDIPVGSTVTSITFYFMDDQSSGEMSINLYYEDLIGIFGILYTYNTGVSFANPGWQSHTTSLNYTTIDTRPLHINVYSQDWVEGAYDLVFKGISVTYEKP